MLKRVIADEERRRRGGLTGELALAVPPTLVVLVVILLIQGVSSQRLLYASLAASAFLIYYDPEHRFNTVRTMVVAQMLGFVLGVGAAMILGAGYAASAVAMTSTILLLVLFDVVHPPAVSTAIAFAFVATRSQALLLFVVAVILIAALVVMQRTTIWLVQKVDRYVEKIEGHEGRKSRSGMR